MTVASELLALARSASEAVALPPVARLHVPAYKLDPACEEWNVRIDWMTN